MRANVNCHNFLLARYQAFPYISFECHIIMKKFNRFIELDFIRALSALWVILTHFWVLHFLPFSLSALKIIPESKEPIGMDMGKVLDLGFNQFFPLPTTNFGYDLFNIVNIFCGLGYQSVHIFFILSGFGLSYSRFLKPDESWQLFLKKRLLRIYPVYWVVLCLAILDKSLTSYNFHLPWQGFLFMSGGTVPFTWFMFPLVQFYLAFPWLFKLVKHYSIFRFLFIVFLIKFVWTFSVIIYGYLRYDSWIGSPFYPGYLAISRLFEFSLGMVGARVYFENQHKLINFLIDYKTICLAIICEVIGTLLVVVKIHIFYHSLPLGLAISDALIGFGIFVILFNFTLLITKISQKLNTLLLFVSEFSYEMYLSQFIGLLFVDKCLQILSSNSFVLIILTAVPLYSLVVGVDILASFFIKKTTLLIISKLKLIKAYMIS